MKSASFVLPSSLEIISGPPSTAHGSHSGTTCNPSVRLYHRAASVPLGYQQLDVINLLDFEHGGFS